jgi:hypothetical protein
VENKKESDQERWLRYARTVSGGISMGIGLVSAYVAIHAITHRTFSPLTLLVAVIGCLLTWQLACRDINGVYLGLCMMSLNATIIGMVTSITLHPEPIKNLRDLSALEQGLVVMICSCLFGGMVLVLLDSKQALRREGKPE